MSFSHLILGRPLLLLPPIPPSSRDFSNKSTLRMRWPKYWSFSFSIIPSKEIPGLISFRMGWLHLLAVQGTLKSLLQHHSSKASISSVQFSCSVVSNSLVTYNKLVIAKLSYALIFTFSQHPVKLYFQKYLPGYCQTEECQQECESGTIPGSFESGLWVWGLCKRQRQPLLPNGSWSVCQRNQAQGQANIKLTSSSLEAQVL